MKKILIVDDDSGILDALSLILEEIGYRTDITFKGTEVFKKIREFHPDLIFLDVLMSGNDGRKICKDLKSSDETKNIPVIMMSAHPSADKSVKECGADDFLAKPFEIGDLLKLIERNLK